MLTAHDLPAAPSGLSTGALSDLREDWGPALTAAALFSQQAVELAAGGSRIHSLHSYLAANPGCLDHFGYVSQHGPTHVEGASSWWEAVGLMTSVPDKVETFVLHADTILLDAQAVSALAPLGGRVAVENMDPAKQCGQSVGDIKRVFELLPEARFVLDIAHSHRIDPSGHLGGELLDHFGDRLAHLHCSALQGENEHWPPSAADLGWTAAIISQCPPVPRIWEQPPLFSDPARWAPPAG